MDQVQVALTMAERAVDEAGRCYDAATDNVQQVLERYGEDSDQFRAADAFCAETYGMLQDVQLAAEAVRKAKPAV